MQQVRKIRLGLGSRQIFKILCLLIGLSAIATLSACDNPRDVATTDQENIVADVNNQNTAPSNQGLAKELQGKPVLVDVYATWCTACKNIKPTLDAVKKQYSKTANFIVLDVTDKKTTEASLNKAKKLGLESFFNANKSNTATVGIINPNTGKVVELLQNNSNKKDYIAALDTALKEIDNN
ncbi:MAG: thioredoxin domain-containing protein [Cyanobacteria bacterium P01_A01_bin.84]